MKLFISTISATSIVSAQQAACNQNHETWVDSYSMDCEGYSAMGWCTKDGQKGPAWALNGIPDESFEDYPGTDGLNALSCPQCGCDPNKIAFPIPQSDEPIADEPLFSEPEGPVACNPNHETWVDSSDTNCTDYFKLGWCTEDGKKGLAWEAWGIAHESFHDYPGTDGFTGLSCPDCGCEGPENPEEPLSDGPLSDGYISFSDPDRAGCNPKHETWTDSSSKDCERYLKLGWCTEDGQKGPAWSANEVGHLSFPDYASEDGFTGQHCPQCGCDPEKEVVPMPQSDPVDMNAGPVACNPNHETWVDPTETNCEVYFTTGWCTSDGKKGPAWKFYGMDHLSFHHYPGPGGYIALSCPQCGCSDGTEIIHYTVPSQATPTEFPPTEGIPQVTLPEDHLSQLSAFTEQFNAVITNTFGEDSTYAQQASKQVNNVERRMMLRYLKFGCQMNSLDFSIKGSSDPCEQLNEAVEQMLDWNNEQFANCDNSEKKSKIQKLAKSNEKKLKNVQKKLERCSRKLMKKEEA